MVVVAEVALFTLLGSVFAYICGKGRVNSWEGVKVMEEEIVLFAIRNLCGYLKKHSK